MSYHPISIELEPEEAFELKQHLKDLEEDQFLSRGRVRSNDSDRARPVLIKTLQKIVNQIGK